MSSFAERNLDRVMAARHERRIVDAAYTLAQKDMADEPPIDPHNFIHYDKETIEADVEYVGRMEALFRERDAESDGEAAMATEQRRRLATVLEVVIRDQAELNNWLGESARLIPASRYDDVANGVDAIAEFERDGAMAYLALALDATSGNPGDKLRQIAGRVQMGELTTIKYFASSDGQYQGQLSNVPRVVVGMGMTEAVALAGLWTQSKSEGEDAGKARKELASHPAQFLFLQQIKEQLTAFAALAEQHGKADIAEILNRRLELVQSIIKSKASLLAARREDIQKFIDGDNVMVGIRKFF